MKTIGIILLALLVLGVVVTVGVAGGLELIGSGYDAATAKLDGLRQ